MKICSNNGSENSIKRYEGLDILKVIAAFFVICMHTRIPGAFGMYITAIARFAVPSFMIITGFFYHNLSQQKRVKSYILKIFCLLLSSNILYGMYHIIVQIYRGNIAQYIQGKFSAESIFNFVFFNESLFGAHLWYLGALLYTILIVELLRKLVSCWKKVLYFVCLPLFFFGLILGNYSFIFFESMSLPGIFLRNFLFTGIPYFTVGLFIFDKRGFFLQCNNLLFQSLWVVFFILTTIIERYILVALNVYVAHDQYISTLFLSVSLFCLFGNDKWNGNKLTKIKAIGRKHSTMIYIVHFFPVGIIRETILQKFDYDILYYIFPFVVFGLSLLFSIFYYKLKKRIKQRVAYRSQ